MLYYEWDPIGLTNSGLLKTKQSGRFLDLNDQTYSIFNFQQISVNAVVRRNKPKKYIMVLKN